MISHYELFDWLYLFDRVSGQTVGSLVGVTLPDLLPQRLLIGRVSAYIGMYLTILVLVFPCIVLQFAFVKMHYVSVILS